MAEQAVGDNIALFTGIQIGTASLADFRETRCLPSRQTSNYEATAETSMARNLVTADSSVFRITNDQEIQKYPEQ